MIKVTSPREIITAIAEDLKQKSTDEQKQAIEEYKQMLLEFFRNN